ncbi:hypothetical protein Q5H93_10175 [Hymenobacter sp. ASUV-10]|uniref:YARHG domain-containing protein n=1 Tax=Hymenobacter aranciens TaxID=3063996 RepID=A0ABT9BDI4_9BACT|nr:hypothetical protein [Hymenobacter sp. ASUV-10]MDO7875097.1 hypothetical protein [Hymenobacter sp. ASUV-10]
MKTICFGGAALLALVGPTFGQSAPPTAAEQLAASVATVRARTAAAETTHPQLINGPEYENYAQRYYTIVGHQFFLTPEKHAGGVFYNGYYFDNLRLSYDVVRDQVVLPQPTSPLQFRLVNEKVGYFVIDGHRFVRLQPDSAASRVLGPGYYEVLHTGPAQVLARRAKRIQEQNRDQRVNAVFIVTDKLFVNKSGQYFAISKKSAALRPFADRSSEMQRYVQEQKLRFNRPNLEASVVRLAQYYTSLPAR